MNFRMIRRVLVLILAGCAEICASPFTFTAIDFPGSLFTSPVAINDAADIVGQYDTSHGFLLSNGIFSTVDYPGALQTALTGITNSGQIVGFTNGTVGPTFLLSAGLYSTVAFPGATRTAVFGISNSGKLVGQYFGNYIDDSRGVIYIIPYERMFEALRMVRRKIIDLMSGK